MIITGFSDHSLRERLLLPKMLSYSFIHLKLPNVLDSRTLSETLSKFQTPNLKQSNDALRSFKRPNHMNSVKSTGVIQTRFLQRSTVELRDVREERGVRLNFKPGQICYM